MFGFAKKIDAIIKLLLRMNQRLLKSFDPRLIAEKFISSIALATVIAMAG